MLPKFGYWTLRGLGQPVRNLLAYTETEYEEIYYQFGPGPDYDRSDWRGIQFNFGLDLPNLPYYIDDHVKLTQSNSILRYLGAKNGLAGHTAEDAARADMLSEDFTDLRLAFIDCTFSQQFEELKPGYLEYLVKKLSEYEGILQRHKWFLGNEISYVDMIAYEYLDVNRLLSEDSFKDFPKILEFFTRFEELPQIKKYFRSTKYIRWPINGPMAPFGGK